MSRDVIIQYQPLNDKQRKFLEYLRDEQDCLGWTSSIPEILQLNKYYKELIDDILDDWELYKKGNIKELRHGFNYDQCKPPTKYLKYDTTKR
jgi:hypothetical protein